MHMLWISIICGVETVMVAIRATNDVDGFFFGVIQLMALSAARNFSDSELKPTRIGASSHLELVLVCVLV